MENKLRSYKAERWKANLDTDLMVFCRKEGIPAVDMDLNKSQTYYELGSMLNAIHNCDGKRTIRDLITITQEEFFHYLGEYYPCTKNYTEAGKEKLWRTMNNILGRHGFRMYVKGKNFDY